MPDQDDHTKVTELRDEHGVVRVPTAVLRNGLPSAYFDEDAREAETTAAETALAQYSPEEVAAARKWSQDVISRLDSAMAAGAA